MVNTNSMANQIADRLLDIEAVALRPREPFTDLRYQISYLLR